MAALSILALAAPCSASSITVSSTGPGGLTSSSAAYRNLGKVNHLSPPAIITTDAYRHSGGYIHALSGTGGLLPAISFSPTNILFSGYSGGSDPATQPLNVSNSGSSTLAWRAGKTAEWLAITPTSGTNTGQITVSASVAGLSPGTYTDAITLTGIGATTASVGVTLTVGARHTLNLHFGGTGSGIVTSSPEGIAANMDTAATFGGEVILHADPAQGSAFSSWSGDCTGAALDCTVRMESDKYVTANFSNVAQTIRIMRGSPLYFTRLQDACDAVQPGEIIDAANINFPGHLNLAQGKAAVIAGGHADNFTTRSGYTTLDGTLTIVTGSLVVDRLAVR